MSSTTKQAITYKSEWLEPEKLGSLLSGLAAAAAAIAKLKQKFPNRRGSKRDLKQLGDDIDDLRERFLTLTELLGKHVSANRQLVESIARLLKTLNRPGWLQQTLGNMPKVTKIVLSHEQRLATLEKGGTQVLKA